MTQPRKQKLEKYYQANIQDTQPNKKIKRKEFLVGYLFIEGKVEKVWISSWSLKHIYDKRPQLCNFFIKHFYAITNYPDEIYRNKVGKKNEYILVKKYNNTLICEVIRRSQKALYIVTAFEIHPRYLRKMERIK